MTPLALDHVEKAYSGGVKALDDLKLEVKEGEFMVPVGPYGDLAECTSLFGAGTTGQRARAVSRIASSRRIL